KLTVARSRPAMPYLNALTCRTSLHTAENLAAVRLSAYNDLSKQVQMILNGSPATHPTSQQALRRRPSQREVQPGAPDQRHGRCPPRLPAPEPRGLPGTSGLAGNPSGPARPSGAASGPETAFRP